MATQGYTISKRLAVVYIVLISAVTALVVIQSLSYSGMYLAIWDKSGKSYGDPEVFGHTMNELDAYDSKGNLENAQMVLDNQLCWKDGTNCKQVSVEYFFPPLHCDMTNWKTIPNSEGATFCSVIGWDDDSDRRTDPLMECSVRRVGGHWEYFIPQLCTDSVCQVGCIKFNGLT